MYTVNMDKAWEESRRNKLIEALNTGKNLDETISSFAGFKDAFMHDLDELDCSDGRVLGAGKKISVAGQGIIASAADQENLIAACRGKVKCVTSHDDCGAAAVKFREMSAAGVAVPPGVKTADDLGQWHSRNMAFKIGAAHRHIKAKDLLNPFHNERAICLDGTGRFNLAALKDMPACFVSSAPGFNMSEEYYRTELRILSGIALGDHGFGRRFDARNPFYIIAIGENAEQLSRLLAMAKVATAEFSGRVEVRGLIRPSGD